jgi:hypothetical protein
LRFLHGEESVLRVYFEDIAEEDIWTEERWIRKWRMHNVELHHLCSSYNIMGMIKSRSM